MDKIQAIEVINEIIEESNKFLPKFKEGTSQNTLLKNRIKALEVSKSLMEENSLFNKTDIEKAIKPIMSIISKTTKVKSKFKDDTYQYNRCTKIINAMEIALSQMMKG